MTSLINPRDIDLITDPDLDFIDYLELDDILEITTFPHINKNQGGNDPWK
jgi:hypothetical protein